MAIVFPMLCIAFMAMIPIFWPALLISLLCIFGMAYQDGSFGMFLFGVYTAACMAFSYWYHFIVNKKPAPNSTIKEK
jgi:hypothetical protein